MTSSKLHRHANDRLQDEAASRPEAITPGKVTLTSKLLRKTVVNVFRLESRDGVAPDAEEHVERAERGGGAPLPPELRARFEAALGADLGAVRIHTGGESAVAAESVGARAYTVGQDVHFGAGEYDPSSEGGQLLIAHEVAHTVQQAGAAPVRQHKLEVSTPGDHLEVEADRAATAMVRGEHAAVSGGGDGLQREVKAGGSMGLSSEGYQFNLSVTPSFKVPLKYAEIEFSAPVSAGAAIKRKGQRDAEGGVEDKKDSTSVKGSINLAKFEREAAAAAGPKIIEKAKEGFLADDGWKVASVDLEGEASFGEKDSVSAGVKLTFVNGQSVSLTLKLYEQGDPGGDFDAGSMEVSYEVPLGSETLWENDVAELVISGKFNLVGSINPKWGEIAMHLKDKPAFRTVLRAALNGLVETMLGAGGLAAGGVVVALGMIFGMINAQDVKTAIKRADELLGGYVGGWCKAWGISGLGGGDAEMAVAGQSAASAQLSSMIARIQQHPMFAAYGFTTAELQTALKDKLKTQGAAVYNMVEAEAKPRIYREVVVGFYQAKEAEWFTSAAEARRLARHVARALNVPIDVIPGEADDDE